MNRDILRTELIRDEELRLKPYRCTSGKLTIGVGRNLDDVGITDLEARWLLDNDIERVIEQLDRALPWWRTLSEARQRVFVNMAFNLGIAGFLAFRKTIAAVKNGRYAEAAAEMLDSVWARQVGARAARLAALMTH